MQATNTTPANTPANAKAARKPRTNTKAQTASQAPAPQALAAQLAAAAAAPAPAPRAAKVRSVPTTAYELTPKGAAFTPDPKRSRVKHEGNQITWLAIKALFADGVQLVTASQIWAAVPTHKDFVGYAVRSGWLAVSK